jgi:hypothetical protein
MYGDGDDGVSYEGGVSRRLVSSSPTLSSSTSQRHFLVRLAGGVTGDGDSVTAWVQADLVGAMTGGGQAVTVAEGHCWRRRRHLRVFATVACVAKRQKRVTSWKPALWFTDTRASCLVATQMSYRDMKEKIEGVVSLEPAHVAAHTGATLRVTLAGRGESDGRALASHTPSTLWGEAGRLGAG